MKQFEKAEIDFIQKRACERITEIFDALGIEYTERYDYIQSACPVHDGNNDRGLFWAIRSSHWQCKTRGCHKDPKTGPSNSVFGLVRGTMSRKTEKPWTFRQSVVFIIQALGLKGWENSQMDAQDVAIAKIIKEHKKNKKPIPSSEGILLTDVIHLLQKDTIYYPNRGVPEDILDKYHISFCDTKGKPMYKRAFFPVLDVTGKIVVGWSGRSIYDKCVNCSMYHHPERKECPDKKYRSLYAKWKHTTGFHGETSLYNIWFAKHFMNKTGTAILCEGPGDVWAYETAGIKNSVALLGTSISRHQRMMLQNAGALTVVCTFDGDKAGQAATQLLQKDLNNYFRVFCVNLKDGKDVGDMLPEDIYKQILPILNVSSREEVLSN